MQKSTTNMTDHLATLVAEAQERIEQGYYSRADRVERQHHSLRTSVEQHLGSNAVIAELKYGSPSLGQIRSEESPAQLAREMALGGACALSVLTATKQFRGDLRNLAIVSRSLDLPILMKDIIVSPSQLQAAATAGADAVVMIREVYAKGLTKYEFPQMMDEAHRLGLEVIAETSSIEEFKNLEEFHPDLYGVNNRDLSSLRIDLETTRNVLAKNPKPGAPVVAESGIESADDIRRLRSAGANAFLIGTSIMRSHDIRRKVREFVEA